MKKKTQKSKVCRTKVKKTRESWHLEPRSQHHNVQFPSDISPKFRDAKLLMKRKCTDRNSPTQKQWNLCCLASTNQQRSIRTAALNYPEIQKITPKGQKYIVNTLFDKQCKENSNQFCFKCFIFGKRREIMLHQINDPLDAKIIEERCNKERDSLGASIIRHECRRKNRCNTRKIIRIFLQIHCAHLT
jgi:hypothetical protein